MPSAYHYIENSWRDPVKAGLKESIRKRMQEWRKQPTVIRVDRPTRLNRARALGYRAKQGYVLVRIKIRRGGLRKKRPILGRRPKRMGTVRHTPNQNLRWIAETRVAKKFTNLRVLNSYYVGEDGKAKYYEVILVDPSHPQIKNDKKINWICEPVHKGRERRGLTSAGRQARGL
ncbi:MAG: 50S ribosomal protein L15e [Candidatus Ranarchaeia archaeon]